MAKIIEFSIRITGTVQDTERKLLSMCESENKLMQLSGAELTKIPKYLMLVISQLLSHLLEKDNRRQF